MKRTHLICGEEMQFMKSIGGTSWGSDPDNILILFKRIVRLVLEYGYVCFAEMAETYLKKLDRVQ
jgi:hypothetical protein